MRLLPDLRSQLVLHISYPCQIYFTLQRASGSRILNGSRPFISFEVVLTIYTTLRH